jgi:AcrR family transcriptional regulator
VTARPRRTYHHGNLRRALLDAALELFIQRGAFDFTLRELAREAGVTHNAPYRHFAGKSELLSALRDEGFAALASACRDALAGTAGARQRRGPPPAPELRARVRVLGEAYVRFAIAHPHHFRLMLHNPLGADPAPTARGEAFVMLHDAIDEARRAGVVRDDLSTREIALAAWALVHGLASLLVEGHVAADEARLRRYVKLLDELFFEGALA